MTHINEALFIGMGGVGSQFVAPACAMLANDPNCLGPNDKKGKPTRPTVVFCDGDKYEAKNLLNQCIRPQDVGLNKAEVAAARVAELVEVEVWPDYIGGPLEFQSWLVSQRTKQDERMKAGLFGGVALIVTAVDNAHLRAHLFEALKEVPNVSVLVIDPANGAGDDAHEVDVVSYLRIYNGKEAIETWPPHTVKWPHLFVDPEGTPDWAKGDCNEKAVSEPQLRTANMLAATLAYEMLRLWLKEEGMPEGYHADVKTMSVTLTGARLPTNDEMTEMAGEVTATPEEVTD